MSKKITLLGSTGSIGTQSLDVIRAQGYEVFGLSAHSHVDKILEQIEEFHPKYVCMTNPDAAAKLGFDGDEKGGKETEEARFARIREAVMTDLKHTFRPEFLNRIDEIIVFRQLTQENIVEIARRMLTVTGKRMAQQGITLISDDDAVAELARDGFDPQYGARPLRRAIQSKVEDAVAVEDDKLVVTK